MTTEFLHDHATTDRNPAPAPAPAPAPPIWVNLRVSVYAGIDPVTHRQRRLKQTCPDETSATIALGRLLEQAAACVAWMTTQPGVECIAMVDFRAACRSAAPPSCTAGG
jgi:hypothetical protein